MNPSGQPQTTIQALQEALAKKRQEIGQRYASIPQTESNLRASLFGQDQTLGTLRGQEETKLKELFQHDKNVAAQYQTPPEQGQVLDPYIRETQLSQRYGGTMQDLAGIRSNISQRRDVLGDAMAKSMQMLEMGIRAAELERNALKDELDFALKLEESRRPKGGSGGGDAGRAAALQELFKTIYSKKQAVTPLQQGTARNKKELDRISKSLPSGQNIKWEKQRNGSYTYSIVSPETEYLQPGQSLESLFAPVMAGFGALYPKDVSAAKNIYETLIPKTEKFGYGVDEGAAGIAGQSKTPENLQRWQMYTREAKEPKELKQQRIFKEQDYLESSQGKEVADRARLAQEAIDSSTFSEATYQRIITAEPDLIPFIHP